VLSVVIPTRNRRALLVELLHALDRQDLPRDSFEVIVVIDGGTDDTAAAVAAIAGDAPRRGPELRCVEQPSRGASAARNHGVRLARGDVVLFLDDDVVPGAGLVSAHHAAHAAGPPGGRVVLGRLEMEYDGGALRRELRRWWEQHYVRLSSATTVSFTDFFTGNVSVTREAVLAAGGFDEAIDYGEDVDFGYRLKSLGLEFAFAPQAVGRSRNTKTVRELHRDSFREGRGSLRMYRKHPATRAGSALDRYGEFNLKMRWARGALLWASAWPPASRLIDLGFAAWAESASTGWASRTMFDLSRGYYFWSGVRSAAEPAEWRELTAPRPTPARPSR
jgi:glycosyltransferase involved in cell wall biosynthesis